MDTILFQNILFAVLSSFIVLLMVCLAILMIYIVGVLKNIYRVSRMINNEGEKIINDIDNVRGAVKNGGSTVKSFVVYLLSLFKPTKKSRKKDN